MPFSTDFSTVRIPTPFVILCCIIVAVGVFLLFTYRIDFLDPNRSTQEDPFLKAVHQTARGLSRHYPEDSNLARTSAESQLPSPSLIESETPDVAPNLSEYRDLAKQSPEKILSLAKQLQATHHPQRAWLAWERIIDTCPLDSKAFSLAQNAIKKLKSTPSSWKDDPIDIVLQIGSSRTIPKEMKTALKNLVDQIKKESDNLVRVTLKITVPTSSANSIPDSPIALWFTDFSDTNSTTVRSFKLQSGDRSEIDQLLVDAVIQLIAIELSQKTTLNVIASLPATTTYTPLSAITRLAWQEFGKTLQKTDSPKP